MKVKVLTCDFDGDLIFTTDQPEFINCAKGGRPISYEKRSATKTTPNDSVIAESDLASMNCKVGFVTNVSSAYHCMLTDYEQNTEERNEIEKRLKALRREQGNTIDAGKGIIVDDFPEFWVKFERKSNEIDEKTRNIDEETRNFDNKLLANKRPLFFIYLYPDYMKKYQKEVKNFDYFVKMKYGMTFNEFLELNPKSDEQQRELDNYYRFSFFIHNDSPMNKLSRYMQSQVKEIRNAAKGYFYDWSFVGERDCEWLRKHHAKYIAMKKAIRDSDEYDTIEEVSHAIRKDVAQESSAMYENARDAIWLAYKNKSVNMEFVWKIFGNEVVEILLDLNDGLVNIPYKDNSGSVEFLFQRYSFKRAKV